MSLIRGFNVIIYDVKNPKAMYFNVSTTHNCMSPVSSFVMYSSYRIITPSATGINGVTVDIKKGRNI